MALGAEPVTSASRGPKVYWPRAALVKAEQKEGPGGPSRLGRQVDGADPDRCCPVKHRVRPGSRCLTKRPPKPRGQP